MVVQARMVVFKLGDSLGKREIWELLAYKWYLKSWE